jgi:hypothetical protein
VFRETVAPTGIVKLNQTNRVLRGYLLGGFVTSAIYWIPDPEVRPLPDPIALIEKEKKLVIDVTQAPNGDIIFCTFDSIHRLILPEPGDCNGDGARDLLDVSAIDAELQDGFAQLVENLHRGDHRGSLGCDANGDLLVDWRDQELIAQFGVPRQRAVRSR